MTDLVVLVDANNNAIGTCPKLHAHRTGILHRAVSVFVFNDNGQVLLQQRARDKYHSAGLWSNTCCTHPLPGEVAADAARRRLLEEMNLSCAVQAVGSALYHLPVTDTMIEHEFDHLFVARFDGEPDPNPEEVDDWRWISWSDLHLDVGAQPDAYSRWLPIIMPTVSRSLPLP